MSAGISYDALLALVDLLKETRVPDLSAKISNFSFPAGQARPPSLQDIKFWGDQEKARLIPCNLYLFPGSFSTYLLSIMAHSQH